MSSESNNKSVEATAQKTIETIYHEVVTGSGRLKTLFEENSDQYLVVRDADGRILIKLSLLGGIVLAIFSLVITRLRWLPLLAVALARIAAGDEQEAVIAGRRLRRAVFGRQVVRQ